MVERAAVAARIRHAREERGLTQKELAATVRVSRRTVLYWESTDDGRVPTMRHLRELEQVLGRKPIWFLHGVGDDPLNELVARTVKARKAA